MGCKVLLAGILGCQTGQVNETVLPKIPYNPPLQPRPFLPELRTAGRGSRHYAINSNTTSKVEVPRTSWVPYLRVVYEGGSICNQKTARVALGSTRHSSEKRRTAIHIDRLPGDRAGLIGAQKQCRPR